MAATTTTFSDLPLEVQEMIGSFLRPQDLACCVRVKKFWKTVFNPLLWKNLEEPEPLKSADERFGRRGGSRRTKESWYTVLMRCAEAGALWNNGDLVETIKFIDCCDEYLEDFLSECPYGMRQLHTAEIEGVESDDDTISSFIGLSLAGWKRLVFRSDDPDECLGFGLQSIEMMQDHVETLEVFRLETRTEHLEGRSLQMLLCKASVLKEFYLMPPSREALYDCNELQAWMIAKEFANGEGWACKELEVFGCQIVGISRPDITRRICRTLPQDFVDMSSSKESADMQLGVYKQLAQLKKLKQLSLGIPVYPYHDDYKIGDRECYRQYDCLSMRLESGLDLLKDLKYLEEVGLKDMEVYIDEEEEQAWVEKNWPKVKVQTTYSYMDYTDNDYGEEGDEDDDDDEILFFGGIPYSYIINALPDEDYSTEYDDDDDDDDDDSNNSD
ncbi:hypothetical protein BGZ95_012115 [Linnemannia exigua]|uniref:F-box domain-containing protein n=1 Tax=Linnemannia exigua TaxID=604196 RepID=A0AAD4DB14_9FUNG|nr:hypothetical protein BGZ95_012115 [Linnemannia exigua]